MGFVTANLDYQSVARQVRDDDGLVEMINTLAHTYPFLEGEGTLIGDDEELSPRAVQFLTALIKEAGGKT